MEVDQRVEISKMEELQLERCNRLLAVSTRKMDINLLFEFNSDWVG